MSRTPQEPLRALFVLVCKSQREFRPRRRYADLQANPSQGGVKNFVLNPDRPDSSSYDKNVFPRIQGDRFLRRILNDLPRFKPHLFLRIHMYIGFLPPSTTACPSIPFSGNPFRGFPKRSEVRAETTTLRRLRRDNQFVARNLLKDRCCTLHTRCLLCMAEAQHFPGDQYSGWHVFLGIVSWRIIRVLSKLDVEACPQK